MSSKFAMKDFGEADVIMGIRMKRVNKGITLMQSHYVEKIRKKFNYSDCSPVSTPMDPSVKLIPNQGLVVSQLVTPVIFGTDQLQVDEAKSLFSPKFAMKDMGEAECDPWY